MTTSGGLGEAEVGGPSLNVVPKTGGNTVKGSVYLSGVTKGMIGSNYTDDLKARGLSTPGSNTKIWDFNGARRRTDQEGSVVVLLHLARRGQPSDRARDVREPQRGRSDQVDVRAPIRIGPPSRPRRSARPRCGSPRRPRRATSSACSGMSRCRAKAPRGRARQRPACRQSGDNEIIAGGTAAPTPAASATAAPETARVPRLRDAFPPGLVAVADDEPSAPRSGRRQLREPVSRQHRCPAVPPSTSFRSRNSAPPGARPTATSREPGVPGPNLDRARTGRGRTTGARRCRTSRASTR